ncbi:MAG: bacillithiol biosynthesis cysteine-adding enzyme BshC [Gemmatimonadales bacterium]
MRLHPTPLAGSIRRPIRREGPDPTGLRDAVVAAPGVDPAQTLSPETLLVTTGQQAGLFTGPLYTIFKALSAAALARVLQEQFGCPVKPLFWIPGDDHDFDEVASARWVTEEGALRSVRLPHRPPDAALRPMWREPLGPEIASLREALVAALPGSVHQAWVVEWLARHYQPGTTVAGAYSRALAELLAPYGVACLDSTHEVFKRAAAPWLLRAAREAGPLEELLIAAADRFRARGDAVPVEVGDGATLLFLDDRHGRDRLVRDGDGFRTRRGGDRYSLADLEAIAAAEPTRLSPNVLLRPVLESAVLPTVAYIGGPGELRYFEMLPGLYRALGVVPQQPVPRWSGAILEPHVERLLAKFRTTPEEVSGRFVELERRIIRSHLPPTVPERIAELQETADRLYAELEAPLRDIDPTLAGPLASSHRQAAWAARDLERKALSRLRAREQVELAQLRRLRGALCPGGTAQERTLTIAPFLARHGPGLLDAIHDEALRWYRGALEGGAGPT